jgi:hypothetical protein
MRILRDSTNGFDIPQGTPMVGGYVDGIFKWSDQEWAFHSGSKKVRIACFSGTNDGDVGDVETGDMQPWEFPGWANMRLHSGKIFVVAYVNRSNRPVIESSLRSSGLTGSQVGLWIATDDGTQFVPQGSYPVMGVQYANPLITGHHYDESFVADYWQGVDVMNPTDVKAVIINAIHGSGQGADPIDTQANVDAYALQYANGKPLDSIVAGIWSTAEAVAYQANVAKLIAAGPTQVPSFVIAGTITPK